MVLKDVKKMGQKEIRETVEKIRVWFDRNEEVQPQLVGRAYMRLLDLLREGSRRNMVLGRSRCSEHLEVYQRFVYRVEKIEDPEKEIPYENEETTEEIYGRLRNVVRICLREAAVF